MKKSKIILGILIIGWLAVIWGHSMQPAVVSAGESGKWLEVLSKIFTFLQGENGEHYVRKAAHFTEYAI